MSKLKLLTLGSDPEFLIIDKTTGKYVSSLDYIPGDKNEPVELTELGEGYTIQKDNVLAEFCVPYTTNAEDLYNNIMKAVEFTNNNILPKELELVATTGGTFYYSELDNEYAKTFGCSPSYNAWNYSINVPKSLNSTYRGAGFHIHIGHNGDEDQSVSLIKALDLFVGLPSVLIDSDKIRRKQYGTAGEFRLTDFGCEYRVLGSFILSKKEYYDEIMSGIDRAFEFVNNNTEFTDDQEMKIQLAINTSNEELAKEILEEFNLVELIK